MNPTGPTSHQTEVGRRRMTRGRKPNRFHRPTLLESQPPPSAARNRESETFWVRFSLIRPPFNAGIGSVGFVSTRERKSDCFYRQTLPESPPPSPPTFASISSSPPCVREHHGHRRLRLNERKLLASVSTPLAVVTVSHRLCRCRKTQYVFKMLLPNIVFKMVRECMQNGAKMENKM